MAYTAYSWDTNSPITASRMNALENGLAAASVLAEAASNAIANNETGLDRTRALALEALSKIRGTDTAMFYFPSLETGDYSCATAIMAVNGEGILFDAGGDKNGYTGNLNAITSYYTALRDSSKVTSLKYIIISHYHWDHVDYLQNILNIFPHENCHAYVPMSPSGYATENSALTRAITTVQVLTNAGIPYTVVSEDTVIDVFNDFVSIQFLNSNTDAYEHYRDTTPDIYNNFSMVSLVKIGSIYAMLPGDIQRAAQDYMLAHYNLPRLFLYVLHHHGIQNDDNPAFLDKIAPEWGIISTNHLRGLESAASSFAANYAIEHLGSLGYSSYTFAIGKDSGYIIEGPELERSGWYYSYVDLYVDNSYEGIIHDGTFNHPFSDINEINLFIKDDRNLLYRVYVKGTSTPYNLLWLRDYQGALEFYKWSESTLKPIVKGAYIRACSSVSFQNFIFTTGRKDGDNFYSIIYISESSAVYFTGCEFEGIGKENNIDLSIFKVYFSSIYLSNCKVSNTYSLVTGYRYTDKIVTNAIEFTNVYNCYISRQAEIHIRGIDTLNNCERYIHVSDTNLSQPVLINPASGLNVSTLQTLCRHGSGNHPAVTSHLFNLSGSLYRIMGANVEPMSSTGNGQVFLTSIIRYLSDGSTADDLNNYTDPGMYVYYNNVAHRPDASGGSLLIMKFSNDYITQIASVNTQTDLHLYMRKYLTSSSSWSDWQKLYTLDTSITDNLNIGTLLDSVNSLAADILSILASLPSSYTSMWKSLFTNINNADLWELGAINSSDGGFPSGSPSSARIRTSNYLSDNVKLISVHTGYRFVLPAWSGNTYIGMWNGSSFVKSATWLTQDVILDKTLGYKYKVVLAKAQNASPDTISSSDYTGIEFNIVTDNTITLAGMAADALAVKNLTDGMLKYTAQTLTDLEKTIARNNIGAPSSSMLALTSTTAATALDEILEIKRDAIKEISTILLIDINTITVLPLTVSTYITIPIHLENNIAYKIYNPEQSFNSIHIMIAEESERGATSIKTIKNWAGVSKQYPATFTWDEDSGDYYIHILLPIVVETTSNEALKWQMTLDIYPAVDYLSLHNLLPTYNFINYITPQQFGAIANGEYNNYTAFTNMFNHARINNIKRIFLPAGDYFIGFDNIENAIQVTSNMDIIGMKGARIISNAQFTAIAPAAGITFNMSNVEVINAPDHDDNNDDENDLINSAFMRVKTTNNSNMTIRDMKTATNGYGILVDRGSDSGKNMLITNNDITSLRDPVEINTIAPSGADQSYNPENRFLNIIVSDNFLNANGTRADINAGFGVGVARGKNVIIADNIITGTRREGIHIEDGSEGIIVMGNIAHECKENGLRLFLSVGKSTEQPIIIGNDITHNGSRGEYVGIQNVYVSDTDKCMYMAMGNKVQNFNVGLLVQNHSYMNAEGCMVRNCDTAVRMVNSNIYGTVFSENCSLLVRCSGQCTIDRLVSRTHTPSNTFNIGTNGVLHIRLGLVLTHVSTELKSTKEYPHIAIIKKPTYFNGIIKIKAMSKDASALTSTKMVRAVYENNTLTTTTIAENLKTGYLDSMSVTIPSNDSYLYFNLHLVYSQEFELTAILELEGESVWE